MSWFSYPILGVLSFGCPSLCCCIAMNLYRHKKTVQVLDSDSRFLESKSYFAVVTFWLILLAVSALLNLGASFLAVAVYVGREFQLWLNDCRTPRLSVF